MKYENYNRINEIIPEIKSKEVLLTQLQDTGLSVLIKAKKNVVFNIPIGFAHEMSKIGDMVIQNAISVVQAEITSLKKELESL